MTGAVACSANRPVVVSRRLPVMLIEGTCAKEVWLKVEVASPGVWR
jgi:hypothetical protein